ncbi:hypothetical protein [Cohnella lupini]|uniref:Uncharacterized protein n=1 Tax=Cohnella lupini TaxID=1294267 RepID=A0A3D9HTF8_9BACL|nr:hypothetical protein [Cohnella lupini]RED52804.1 hypothetical protein DFP95_1308 [Cohnella lupini]
MMNEWPAAVWASISAMTAAMVLSFIIVLGSFARQGAAIQQEDDSAVAIVKEYRQYNQYDNTTNLYPQDVISAIAESRGTPEIWVERAAGTETFRKWTAATPPEEFGTAYLMEPVLATSSEIFYTSAKFRATLEKDLNGSIINIQFRRQ